MNKVYCIVCKKEYSIKGIFTHYDRSHGDESIKSKYSNGHNGKYNNVSLKLKSINEHKRKSKLISDKLEYDTNPKTCPKCGSTIEFSRRKNKFCTAKCGNSRTHSENTKNKIRDGNLKFLEINPEFGIQKKLHHIKCDNCNNIFENYNPDRKFCSRTCSGLKNGSKLRDIVNMNKTEKEIYKKLCMFKFNLMDYKDEFDFSLIEEHGWYKAKNKGNNLNGISRDHMISITFGFKNNIDPNIISHPANCVLMRHSKNSSKGIKNSITLDELLTKIEMWNSKYY